MRKDLFKDFIRYFPSKLIPSMVGIFALPIVTRLFSPSVYGDYTLVAITISLVSTFAGWISISVLRFFPAYEKIGKSREFTNLAITLAIYSISVISFISMLILFIIKNNIPKSTFKLFIIGVLVFILTTFFSILLSFLRIKRLIIWFGAFSVWQSITTLLIGVLFVIVLHLGVEGLLWGSVVSSFIALPLLWKIATGSSITELGGVNLKITSELAGYSFPLVFGNLAAWVLSLSDRYMIQFFRNTYEVGLYSISYQISNKSIMFFTALFTLTFNPLSMIIWEKESIQKSRDFLSLGTRYFLLLCIPAIIGISVLREPILEILSTKNYYEGAKAIPFVVLGVFFLGLNQRFGMGLSFHKKTRYYMYSLIAAGFINVCLNLLFISRYGYLAAAITTMISYAFLLFFTIIFSRFFFTWKFPFRSLLKACGASAAMGLYIYYFGLNINLNSIVNLILNVFMGGIIYILILLLLQEFDQKEKETVIKVIKNFAKKN